jgi:hypothetical protein
MRQLQLRFETQRNEVADEVSALIAVVRPILLATLHSLKQDVVDQAGGYEGLRLKMLPRLYRRGDGDCGICFEYAVHDALVRSEASVVERVVTALEECRVPGQDTRSILFAAEKTGSLRLIETARDVLTEESSLLYGSRGRPVKLRRHIDSIATAFRRKEVRDLLPQSIGGLWKADLFLGNTDTERWVGTSVKINPSHLEAARGLRIGIVPTAQGQNDAVRRDPQRNLVICPLPYDGAFMEVFYNAWGIVQQFVAADAQLPPEPRLPRPLERHVARLLVDRRDFSVLEAVDGLSALAQPELLQTSEHSALTVDRRTAEAAVGAAVAPLPRQTG